MEMKLKTIAVFTGAVGTICLYCAVCLALPGESGTLKGVVLANELGGRPAPHVEISAIGANPTQTGNDGIFVLTFPNKLPGDAVQIQVSKPGYAVVNFFQLRTYLPRNSDSEPLNILISPEAETENWARKYLRIKAVEPVNEAYEAQVKELQETHRADAITIARLQRERDQAVAVAEQLADQLAKLKPQDMTDLYAKALDLFLKGDASGALGVLNDENLSHEVDSAQKIKAEAERKQQEAVQAYILKARILTTQFRFAEAEHVFKSTVQKVPDSVEAHFAYAQFSQELNHIAAARREYERALELAQRSDDSYPLIACLGQLGNLDLAQNRLDDAYQRLTKAVALLKIYPMLWPEQYLPELASATTSLAIVEENLGKHDEAHRHDQLALAYIDALAKSGQQAYRLTRANLLQSIANIEDRQNRRDDAREHYLAALELFSALDKQGSLAGREGLAATLNNLGELETDYENTKADDYFRQALPLYQQLATGNPERYLPDVAMTENNLGFLEVRLNKLAEARPLYEDALKIRRKLADSEPEAYLPLLAQTLANLGDLEEASHNPAAAKARYQEALSAYAKLPKEISSAFAPQIAFYKAKLAELGD